MGSQQEVLPTLEVMIATCGADGGRKVEAMNLPEIEGVSYLVSWQDSDAGWPASLSSRADVKLLRLDGRGLSRNRNNLLDNATAEILLVCDDDLTIYPEGLNRLRTIFQENPQLEYGSFRYTSDFQKKYPAGECNLTRLPKNFFQTSFEIAVRRCSAAGKLRFHTGFGLGAPRFTSGEEELFLLKARRMGIDCRFFPIDIFHHQGETTGIRSRLHCGSIRARGVLTALEYPLTAPLRVLLGAYRIARNRQAPFFKSFRLLLSGMTSGYFSQSIKEYLTS